MMWQLDFFWKNAILFFWGMGNSNIWNVDYMIFLLGNKMMINNGKYELHQYMCIIVYMNIIYIGVAGL